jgi:hypothetical protein
MCKNQKGGRTLPFCELNHCQLNGSLARSLFSGARLIVIFVVVALALSAFQPLQALLNLLKMPGKGLEGAVGL